MHGLDLRLSLSASAQPTGSGLTLSPAAAPSSTPATACSFELDSSIGLIILRGLRLINSLALVNRPALQAIISADVTCLQMRHILSRLIILCTPTSSRIPSNSSSSSSVTTSEVYKTKEVGKQMVENDQSVNSITVPSLLPYYSPESLHHINKKDPKLESVICDAVSAKETHVSKFKLITIIYLGFLLLAYVHHLH
ncbi:unnamed protein product [Protopolystoma xenopodis]|uniref:Uncharacterized protein n=1 Tax=Protopolystoma xenopodis TaxID=117903 RepID=A0A3S5B5C6_9PLAT|nr:unnamed protein product [Protopolystoma xenopodis]